MWANKFDLKIATVILGADDTYEDIGGRVPVGMVRFVCHVKASILVVGEKIVIAESTNVVGGTPAPKYAIKDVVRPVEPGIVAYPEQINLDCPQFRTSDDVRHMGVKGDSAGDVITIRYYDQ